MVGRSAFFLSFLINFIILCSFLYSQVCNGAGDKNFYFPNLAKDMERTNMSTDKFWAPDKAQHLLASTFSTIFVYKFSRDHLSENNSSCKFIAAGFSISWGFAKEIMDNRKKSNIFSWKDLLADSAGIIIGLVIVNQP